MRLQCRSPRLMAYAVAAGPLLPPPPGQFGRRSAGWAASSTLEPSRSTARGRCLLVLRPIRIVRRRRRLTRGGGSAIRWILGVRALNTFITVCRGQRMGIFSGSGVGKSVLLSMLARNVSADISVIGLVASGAGRSRNSCRTILAPPAFVVVSTSDEPALMRRQAAYLTLAIAEYFRDLGKDVLVLMDSVTPLRDGAARDRTLCRRTADRQGLYPDRICGIAAPAGAGRARHRAGDRSRAFSACSSMVMITTSRSLTPSGAFSMVISSWNGRSPSVADIRRSTSSSRSRERCRGRPIQTTCRQSTGRVR